MAAHFLVANGYVRDRLFPGLEGRAYVPHFFTYGVPPEGVAIFSIKGFSFLDILRNLDAKLVGADPVFGLDLGDDAVSFTEGK